MLHDSLKLEMKHDHVLKKLTLDPNHRVKGVVMRGWVGVSGQNICYHAAALSDSL